MCALAHYFEQSGLPTVVVALIREHAEGMRPPRALWVPFELGRPLGEPEDAAFQRRVIEAAFGLFDRPAGPVLEDYPEDAPADGGDALADEGWVCPVSFAQPGAAAPATHRARLAAEVAQLRPWHEAWKSRRGATGVGVAGIEMDAVAAYIGGLADGQAPAPPVPDVEAGDALKLVVGDLMTFYQEAANAQPGAAGSFQAVSDWFWGDTAAGRALLAVRETGAKNADAKFARVAERLILPHVAQRHAAGD